MMVCSRIMSACVCIGSIISLLSRFWVCVPSEALFSEVFLLWFILFTFSFIIAKSAVRCVNVFRLISWHFINLSNPQSSLHDICKWILTDVRGRMWFLLLFKGSDYRCSKLLPLKRGSSLFYISCREEWQTSRGMHILTKHRLLHCDLILKIKRNVFICVLGRLIHSWLYFKFSPLLFLSVSRLTSKRLVPGLTI